MNLKSMRILLRTLMINLRLLIHQDIL